MIKMGSARLLAGYFEEMTNGVVLEERVQVCIGCIGYPDSLDYL